MHAARIVAMDVLDVRFPTSEHLDGSDAMNPEPDYSAAYVVVRADADDGRSEAIPRCRASDGDAARCVPGVRDTRRASGGDH